MGALIWFIVAAGFALLELGVGELLFWFFLRPRLRKRMDKPLVLDETPRALVGSRAEVVEDIGPGGGQVRFDGSLWSARALDPAKTIPAGSHVTVYDIDGPVAVVWKES